MAIFKTVAPVQQPGPPDILGGRFEILRYARRNGRRGQSADGMRDPDQANDRFKCDVTATFFSTRCVFDTQVSESLKQCSLQALGTDRQYSGARGPEPPWIDITLYDKALQVFPVARFGPVRGLPDTRRTGHPLTRRGEVRGLA